MAFRYAGLNWEGRRWTAAGSIRSLGEQLDRDYPTRPKTSDGTVASKTHDAVSPTSDHRPHPTTGPGIVRALDGTVTTAQGDLITETLRLSKDPRIKYVIWNQRSYSPPTWSWKSYTGAPHDKHFHLSTLSSADALVGPWQLLPSQPEEPMSLPITPSSPREEIRRYQLLLNKTYGTTLTTDGVYGTSTATAVKANLLPLTGADEDPNATVELKAGQIINAAMDVGLQQAWVETFTVNTTTPTGGLSEAQVKAIINGSSVVAP